MLLDFHIWAKSTVDIFYHAACPLDAAQYPVVHLFDSTEPFRSCYSQGLPNIQILLCHVHISIIFINSSGLNTLIPDFVKSLLLLVTI